MSGAAIPCWSCEGDMVWIGHDVLYDYYRCHSCGKERMVEIERKYSVFPLDEEGNE